jgi:hypothetical protein
MMFQTDCGMFASISADLLAAQFPMRKEVRLIGGRTDLPKAAQTAQSASAICGSSSRHSVLSDDVRRRPCFLRRVERPNHHRADPHQRQINSAERRAGTVAKLKIKPA